MTERRPNAATDVTGRQASATPAGEMPSRVTVDDTQVGHRDAERQSGAEPRTHELVTLSQRELRHELRTPLNQIIGYSEMLLEDAREEGREELAQDLARIEGAGRKLLELIDEHMADLGAKNRSRRPLSGDREIAVSHSPQVMETAPGHATPEAGSQNWILVVDDDEANRDLLGRRLKQAGYSVVSAANGQEALAQLERRRFTLVVLDVLMPGMSGLEVLGRVRRQYDAADVPVIMATALDASEDVVEALRRGANDYVTKPLDIQVVLARVGTQIGLKQARDKVRELNERLDAAQNRIASLVESSPKSSSDAAAWGRSIASEVSSALGRVDVVVWLFEGSHLVEVSDSELAPPDMTELTKLEKDGVLYRSTAVLIPVRGQSGKLFGVMGVATGSGQFGETEEHLVTNFARHLGGSLELGEMRMQLARSAAQRRATEQDLLQSGVDLLQLCPVCSRCYTQFIQRCADDNTLLSPPAWPLPYRVAQRYRLQRLVGEGGMGTVFRAIDERLGREVAVKVMKQEHFHNESARVRFEAEARLVAKLDHPSVIGVFDSGEVEGGSLFMVMEWLDGKDLACVLEEHGPGAPRQVATLLRQAGAALSAAHEAKLVHRDVKPENIFVLVRDGRIDVKVLDFGVAKELNEDHKLTRTGSLIGTPLYMSPEQVTNKQVDARSDTYSLATVAYEALTGRRTIMSNSFADVVLAVTGDSPPALSEFLRCSPDLDATFGAALAKDPNQRPQTTAEWAEAVAASLELIESNYQWKL